MDFLGVKMIRGAVLGSPISHSLSPLLHSDAFRYLGINGNYEAIEVGSGELAGFLKEGKRNFDYFSLTMPLKEELLTLDYPISEIARKSQSANTLFKSGQEWMVTSTDGVGFINSLRHIAFENFESVLILGAGGTARAIASALDGIASSITVMGRTNARKESLESIVRNSSFNYIRWSDNQSLTPYSLIVNTTPAGAADLLAENIDYQVTGLLYEVIYKPWPTVLVNKWNSLEARHISGLELLIYQGIEQIRIAIALDFDQEDLAEYLRNSLKKSL
jgi:shikimate dehydrogenase